MSTNTTKTDESPTLGSRENYWGGSEEPTADAYDVDDEDDRSGHSEHAGVNRDRWIAGSILRGAPETALYCPECWSELSDPLDYVPRSEVELEVEDDDGEVIDTYTEVKYADHRRHRHCPTCGEISWGGVLADVETSVFLKIVGRILDAIDVILDSKRDELLEAARERKSNGLSDVANVERLLLDVRDGVETDD